MRAKISFLYSKESDHHFRQLKKLVNQQLASMPKGLLRLAKLRAVLLILLYLSLYSLALFFNQNPLLFYCLYLLMGIMVVFIFLNLVHEARSC